jgi:hypothetical protein
VEVTEYQVSATGLDDPMSLFLASGGRPADSVPEPFRLVRPHRFGSQLEASEIELSPSCTCELSLEKGTDYSATELCLMDVFAHRCGVGDRCLVDCLVARAGDGVGGGCAHVCFAYTGVPLPGLPSGRCTELDPALAAYSEEAGVQDLIREILPAE